jgi:hypothetical protein
LPSPCELRPTSLSYAILAGVYLPRTSPRGDESDSKVGFSDRGGDPVIHRSRFRCWTYLCAFVLGMTLSHANAAAKAAAADGAAAFYSLPLAFEQLPDSNRGARFWSQANGSPAYFDPDGVVFVVSGIEVNVHNDLWGPLFGYRGSFTTEWASINDGHIPEDLVPVRYERRE